MDEFRAVVEAWLARTQSSQAGLARQSTVPQNVISRWLGRHPTRPTPANLAKLAPVIGVPYEELMRMCGYLPGDQREPRAEIDAKRQAVRERFERWADAVGPEYEDFFWTNLTNQAESNLRLIDEIRTAVNAERDAAVSAAVSDHPARRRKSRRDGGESLARSKHTLTHPLGYRPARTNALCAA